MAVTTRGHSDVLTHCRFELIAARDAAAAAYDRCEALRQLVDEIANREAELGRPLTIEDLTNTEGEEERARVRALVLRAFPEREENREWTDPQQPD